MNTKLNSSSLKHKLASDVSKAATIIVTGILAATLPIMAAAQTEKDSLAIRAQIEAYQSTWNTHQEAALAGFFTDDADMVMGNMPAAHGRQAIQDWWGDYFTRQEPERTINIDVKLIRLLSSDVALANIATTTGGQDANGKALLARKARGAWQMRKRGGDWLIETIRGFPVEADSVELNRSLETADLLQPQIRMLVHNYEIAFDSHDPAAISEFYTDDADVMARNLPPIHGRQAIFDWWRNYFSKSKSDKLAPENWYNSMRPVLIIDDIKMITPDIARINITATGAAKKPTTKRSPRRYARATWVVVREAGEWRISALWILPSEEDNIIRRSSR